MNTCKLPDSPEKQALVEYLKKKIKECDDKVYEWAGNQRVSLEEEKYQARRSVYEEILRMIR